MRIRAKIISIVLPLIIVTLTLAGFSAYFASTSGISEIARNFLGFKAEELEKYTQNQWKLLVDNNFTNRPDMVEATKAGVEAFAYSIIRSNTELILAFNSEGVIEMQTGDLEISSVELRQVRILINEQFSDMQDITLGSVDRVGKGFWFEPFGWYLFITEERDTFYSSVNRITNQTIIIIAVGVIIAIIMLAWLSSILTKPLNNVVVAMKEIIADNDLSRRVKVEFDDETGELAHTFNIMSEELEEAYRKIKDFAYQAVLSRKKERKIRNMFEKYVPQDLIDSLFANPESMLIGNNRHLSILFSDIRSFTTISERMAPDDLVNSLNRYFEIMVDIIMNKKGIVDKYIGDAIMAFFGAPVAYENDTHNSVLAALEMVDGIKMFNQQQIKLGKPEFKTGIGVNYGEVTVGNIGTDKKMDYTVIGDAVNLASRLEGLTKEYGQDLIISEALYDEVKDKVICRFLDTVAVKGKTKGVKIYAAVKELSEKEKKAWDIHGRGMDFFLNRQFKESLSCFDQVQQIIPGDKVSLMIAERSKEYLSNPPPENWDGVTVMKTK
ncbi:MAG: adenylate/guanylate cyclase domain-containing protein [Spirochaetaceae bacterium]|jgi:adenylate cyclase|nr:adenylate/guanylate cyclase domain-containing protein [Spirochaetaceae bacterium]